MKTSLRAAPKKSWIFALIVAAGVAGYVFLIFLPGQRATAELRREFEQQKLFVQDCGQLDMKLSQLEQKIGRATRFTEDWHASAASEARLADVFAKITEHGDAAQVEIARFEPQPPTSLSYLRRVPVEMAVEGTYHQVFAFIGALERLEADFWIERLQVEPIASTAGKLRCELRLVLFAGGADNSN